MLLESPPIVRAPTITLRLIALACLITLAQFHLRQITTASIQYDDAHNANVAKNLAFGFGYSTSYHDIVPFNPEASTGPAVLLPAAAFVRLFGNRYWVPTFSIVVCMWMSILLVLFLLRGFLAPRAWWIATALLVFGLSLYDADEFGLLGDVPAAFLAVASLLVLCREQERTGRTLAAGLLLGVAIQAKLLVALVIPSALVYLLIAPRQVSAQSAGRVRACANYCLGALVPSVLWQFVQLASMRSFHGWADLNARQFAFIRTWSGANIVRSTDPGSALLGQVSLHATSLLESFNGWSSLILFPAAMAVSVGIVLSMRRNDRGVAQLRSATLVLAAAGVTHIAWWFTFDTDGWYRHLLPAVVYLLIASSMAVAASVESSPRAGAVAMLLLLLSWMPQLPNLKLVFKPFRRESRLSALLAARDEMLVLQGDRKAVFVGHGWWVARDLEYLLPTVGNFKDSLRLQPDDVRDKKIILVRNEFYNRDGSPYADAFQRACDRQMLFTREPFVISVCPSLPAGVGLK
jgi:4-amino-4-deoxy-L-arabinose transferase-like glycosyltransferase